MRNPCLAIVLVDRVAFGRRAIGARGIGSPIPDLLFLNEIGGGFIREPRIAFKIFRGGIVLIVMARVKEDDVAFLDLLATTLLGFFDLFWRDEAVLGNPSDVEADPWAVELLKRHFFDAWSVWAWVDMADRVHMGGAVIAHQQSSGGVAIAWIHALRALFMRHMVPDKGFHVAWKDRHACVNFLA